jgi:hypothetical protein
MIVAANPALALGRSASPSAGEAYPRVCHAWHRTEEVQVLLPGVRRAEG